MSDQCKHGTRKDFCSICTPSLRKVTKVAEIIPDHMPDWMREAMDEGQLFNRMIEAGKERNDYRKALEEINRIGHPHGQVKQVAQKILNKYKEKANG